MRRALADSALNRARNDSSTAGRTGGGPRIGSAPCSWSGLSAAGSSSRASGLPAALRSSVASDLRRGAIVEPAGKQRLGVLLLERPELELRDPRRLETPQLALAHGYQHRDPFRLEPASHEQQGLGRGVVQPLGVVDTAQDGRLLAGFREEAQYSERDQEAVLDTVSAEAECALERGRLRPGKPADQVQVRPHELMDAGKRQLVLGLDAHAAQHLHVRGLRLRVLEQSRLPDSGCSA